WGFWWRLVRWDPAQADYIYYREDEGPEGNPPDFDPGLGYWIIQWWSTENDDGSVEGDTLDVQGAPVSSAQDYVIPLQAVQGASGFNQVANPFLFDIDFADARVGDAQGREMSFAQAADEGIVDAYAYLWDWEQQAYVPISSTEGGRIPTWRGFWVEQLDPNLNIHLILPPMEAAGGVSKSLATARPTAEDWYVGFAVRGTGLLDAGDGPVSAFVQDISNRAGVKRDASRSNDPYDALDLTVLSPAYVYAYFPHDEEDEESQRPARYTYDYRDPEWDEQSWLFVVETSLSSAEFEWVWTTPGSVPRGYTVALVDATADTVIIPDITQKDRHEFSASVDAPRRFQLRATYVDVIGDATTDRLVDEEDAQAILAHVTGIQPLEEFALEFAEVTGGNPSPASISSYDAAWVLRYDSGLVDNLPASTMDLVEGERVVHLAEPVQALDGTFAISLFVDPADGVLSGDIQLHVDAEEIEVLDVTSGHLPLAQIAHRTDGDQLTIGVADATGATGRAVLARLHVRAPMAVQDVIEHIELTSVDLNEARLAARVVAARPAEAFLYPAAPNPFNSTVQIRFGLPEDTTLELAIYNVLGQRIRDLSTGGSWAAGIHRVAWNGQNDAGYGVASGIYFVQTSTPAWQAVQKVVLIR
ncbi:MAG: T9SS type A sorting domain-containing protein, partial [Gemmatimonadetes bacterium]|nr:T9SS type A sorting domain-containing protein [Gemmatimonadota bacterium]